MEAGILGATILAIAAGSHRNKLVAKLESAGYSQIREIKSTAEGTAVKAMKNGKEVSLVVDSGGKSKSGTREQCFFRKCVKANSRAALSQLT